MMDDGRLTTDDEQRMITMAHPELCSDELKLTTIVGIFISRENFMLS